MLGLDTITFEQMPAISRLLLKSFVTGATSVLEAKSHYGRTLPSWPASMPTRSSLP